MHSVVFGGFSAESLAGRILDSKPSVVITASAVKRGAKPIDLKVPSKSPCTCPQHRAPTSHSSTELARVAQQASLLVISVPPPTASMHPTHP